MSLLAAILAIGMTMADWATGPVLTPACVRKG